MTDILTDVLIVGSGFGGCLTGLILDRLGLRVVIVDRAVHPRFTIGESSTPLADLLLRDLATRYDLPRLLPLTRYGNWREAYPEIVCGCKRGFSYFAHARGRHYIPAVRNANALLVAASSADAVADTHWFRADVDAFFACEVRDQGIALIEGFTATETSDESGWILTGQSDGKEIRVRARFLIDASGSGRFVANALGLKNIAPRMKTRSRALYGHFQGVTPWASCLEELGVPTVHHPFRCDDAAVHHLFEGGWMWQLRFDNGITSAGFVLDDHRPTLADGLSPSKEWAALLSEFPSLAMQFASARIADPPGEILRTARLQRRMERIVGPNWAALPSAACFVDPLHSTGIAQTLWGIEHLTGLFERSDGSYPAVTDLENYENAVQAQISLIDELVHGCYRSFGQFPLMAAFSMLYFAAATMCEHRRTNGRNASNGGFLLSGDAQFRSVVRRVSNRLKTVKFSSTISDDEISAFEREVAADIAPYNIAGLFNPGVENMYRHTAAVK